MIKRCWFCLSSRSGCQHKAWGGAQRNLRIDIHQFQARETGDSENTYISKSDTGTALSLTALLQNRCRPLRGLCFVSVFVLGFRCAPPQSLCWRPLRGLKNLCLNLFRAYFSLSIYTYYLSLISLERQRQTEVHRTYSDEWL